MNISSCNDLLKLSCVLAEACPRAQAAFGKLDFNKIYGGCFSEDRCWYRCVVQRMINNEKCQVLYIDYGNSEIINRSEIVEIPENLQYPSVAKKYRLWGLRLPADQNLNMFDQGKTFLGSLVFEKAIKVRQKAKQKDDTILVQAECEKVDIGEEVAKAGFAEKYRSPGSTEDVEKREDAMQNQCKKMRAPAQLWVNKPGHALCNRPRVFLDPVAAPARNEVFAGNRMILTKDKTPASAPVLNRGLACVRDQNLAEENDIFEEEKGAHRKENLNLLRRQKELELEVEHLKGELQIINQEKEASRKRAEHLEETLHKYIGTKMRDLAANVKVLKEIRHAKKSAGFGEQLSQAIKLVTEGNITVPCSLEKLQKLWTEYDLAQEVIRLCENVFKKEAEQWLNRTPNSDNLLSIKKAVKSLKAQLRWKLTEKNNTEESDDYSELEITRIKEEIAALRNKLLQEIYREQEEYEKLAYLVQKWFPELPLLYPEAGILSYMNSGGLLSHSLERDLLDAEPMKKLSTKRPLVCSEIQDQKVLLKGYSVDVSSEAKVIERVAKYHRAWDQQKEKSSLLQLLFLLFCKSDPLVYLMVPYYPGASLTAVQADAPLTLEETLKVMKGVAQGLQTLHGANIVHGSLHGNNVFAVNRKQGIVGDFDFTKSEEQRAAADTMVIGTLSLVSPELKMGQPASPASDMYAYGCLLFWDDKVKSLILNLFRCDRLTAEQVLRDDCFLLADAIPVPSQLGEEHEPPKEHDSEKTDEEEDAVNSEKNAVNPTQ